MSPSNRISYSCGHLLQDFNVLLQKDVLLYTEEINPPFLLGWKECSIWHPENYAMASLDSEFSN